MVGNRQSRSDTLHDGHSRPIQALVVAVASTLGVLTVIAIMGAWSVLADVYPVMLAIAGGAGLIGSVLKSLPWYLAALVGSVFGLACAFGVATYAVSRI
jgi:hypothetical protein